MNNTRQKLIEALEDALVVLMYHEGYKPYNPIVRQGREALAAAKKVSISQIDKKLSELDSELEQ